MTDPTDLEPTSLPASDPDDGSLDAPAPALDEPAATGPAPRRPSHLLRFAVAFLVSLVAVAALGTGAIYAYEQQHAGRVLPGVRVGDVDVSGLDREAAIAKLTDAYASLGEGRVVIAASVAQLDIPYADFARRADVEAMADAALAIGRAGSPVDRAVTEVRTVLHGVAVDPRVTLDAEALARRIDAELAALELAPVDGAIRFEGEDLVITESRWGRSYDAAAVTAAILAQVGELDALSEVTVEAAMTPLQPAIDDTDIEIARTTTERVVADIELAVADESWAIETATVRSWIDFAVTPDGRIGPVADPAKVAAALEPLAAKIEQAPRNASFKIGSGGSVVGVEAGRDGRTLDTEGTVGRIAEALAARAGGRLGAAVEPALVVTKPTVTTEEAERIAPLMERISSWTTYFPISEKNGYGANIWIPTLEIDGYVVGAGETFDFWEAVGPVTREKGYKDGGAIINGRTEPFGALAGGICSCSTTLFNAALRAGLDMGARRNHYYYIDRYPLGLDATVFKSGSGSVQTMSFTNDTEYPILIRGFKIKDGSKGYVRFDLYSVPTGRTVSFSKPVVKNIRPATTRTEITTTLAPGARKQIEYPADGKDVWVTRTVRDAAGNVIHTETFYSHYSRVDGIILVGKSAPKPTPSPDPSTKPSAPPADPSPSP
jgi:vancomycin resistance protein YoaR